MTTKNETLRHRAFKLLAGKKSEMTGRQIAEGLGTKGIPNFLKDEVLAGRLNSVRLPNPKTGKELPALYSLTKTGIKAWKEQTVDSEAPAPTNPSYGSRKKTVKTTKKSSKKASSKKVSSKKTKSTKPNTKSTATETVPPVVSV